MPSLRVSCNQSLESYPVSGSPPARARCPLVVADVFKGGLHGPEMQEYMGSAQ